MSDKVKAIKKNIAAALDFDDVADAEHNLAGLYADIKEHDEVGARTLGRVMRQIAAVRKIVSDD